MKQIRPTKLICGSCGTEVLLPENERPVAGMAIGRNSNLGTLILPTKQDMQKLSPRQRKQFSSLFGCADVTEQINDMSPEDVKALLTTITSSMSSKVGRSSDAVIDIKKSIEASGTILEHHLYKQHVLAQMFKFMSNAYHLYSWSKLKEYNPSYFHQNMLRCGYDYTWDVLCNKLYEQYKMHQHHDEKCFIEDNRWYNKELAIKMFDDYVSQFNNLIHIAKTRRFGNIKYYDIRTAGNLLPKSDTFNYKKGLPVEKLHDVVNEIHRLRMEIMNASTPLELYNTVNVWNHVRPSLFIRKKSIKKQFRKDTQPYYLSRGIQCKAWQSAFKGYGAYFSMQNLILFYGMRFKRMNSASCDKLGESQSIARLDRLAHQYRKEGHNLLGAFKQFLEDNEVNIKDVVSSWK